jgi:hypothetical protein
VIKNPAKLKKLPTKVSPVGAAAGGSIRVSITGARVQIGEVTCDDFDQFAKARRI